MRRLLSRALDGPHPWGELRVVAPARGGWRRYSLVVYPPGIDVAGRRLMRLRSCWPSLGAILGVGALLVGGQWAPPAILTPAVVAGYLAVAIAALRASRRSARATLRLEGVAFGDLGRVREIGDIGALRAAVIAFEELDAAGLDPVAYELGWWAIYDELSTQADDPSGSRRPA